MEKANISNYSLARVAGLAVYQAVDNNVQFRGILQRACIQTTSPGHDMRRIADHSNLPH